MMGPPLSVQMTSLMKLQAKKTITAKAITRRIPVTGAMQNRFQTDFANSTRLFTNAIIAVANLT